MNEKEVQKILTKIIGSALNEADADIPELTPDIILPLTHLAKKHDLAHIVSDFVFQNNINIAQEIKDSLQHEELMSVYRCEQLKYTLDEISGIFDEAKIAYIPLKGSVIRSYYPTDSMRTSCDIDILIHETDLDSAVCRLESKGYKFINRKYHDVLLQSPNNVHLELHFSIQENIEGPDAVLKDAWQYARNSEGSRYDFQKEFFVFYIYAHIAYHFLTGGCGIRSLMDVWIMEHKMDAPYSCAEKLLKKAGIYQFSAEMSNLAEHCFAGNGNDDFYDTVLEYIFDGGAYGSIDNKITVNQSRTDNLASYTIKRLFLPYKSMVISFPVLKTLPFLLPFCWVARWIKALSEHKKEKFTSEISAANSIPKSKIAETKYIFSRLGL